MLGTKVSDLYKSFAGNFFSRDFRRKREKRRARGRKGPGTRLKARRGIFPARRTAIRTIMDCGVRVERFHISNQALRNVRSVLVSINAITRSLV